MNKWNLEPYINIYFQASMETLKCEQELKVSKLQLNAKKEYIVKIEGRIREMEDTVAGIKSKTVIVGEKVLSIDDELRVTGEKIQALEVGNNYFQVSTDSNSHNTIF